MLNLAPVIGRLNFFSIWKTRVANVTRASWRGLIFDLRKRITTRTKWKQLEKLESF